MPTKSQSGKMGTGPKSAKLLRKIRELPSSHGPRKKRTVVIRPVLRTSPRANAGKTIVMPVYFTAPVWGSSTAVAGGTYMHVQLGPASLDSVNRGSAPEANTPTVMERLNGIGARYAGFGWVAGHLLNDNLGGPGTAWNLTALTTAGNGEHSNKCEEPIKALIVRAHTRAEYSRNDEHWYGVDYTVKVIVDETWELDGHESYLKHVARRLEVSWHTIKQHKLTGTVTATVTGDFIHEAPVNALTITNTGYDLLKP